MIGPLGSPTVEDIFISQKEKLYRHLCLPKKRSLSRIEYSGFRWDSGELTQMDLTCVSWYTDTNMAQMVQVYY